VLLSRTRTEPRRHSSRFESGAPSLELAFPHDDFSPPYRFYARPSNSRRLPSLAFLPPPTVCSTTDLASLFHPAAASRIHSSRACSCRTATTSRRRRSAFLSVLSGSLLAPKNERHVPESRLQGFVPCGSPVSRRRGLADASTRSLPELFPPPGLALSSRPTHLLKRASAHRLSMRLSSHPHNRRTAC
jgi:hypothetical protein